MHNNKSDFNHFIETQLNHEQKNAVEPKNGSFLVIAGAGSGKTRVITARITNLILNHQVPASSIIALTFTNKAAAEMQHRIAQFLPDLIIKPTIATFHAYCLKLLKKYYAINQKPQFNVIDAQDAQKLIQTIVKEQGMERFFNSKQLLSYFSTLKMHEALQQQPPEWNMHNIQQFMQLYNQYQHQKTISNYMDFDDLLYKTYELFNTDTDFHALHIKNHRHILVDEYQDTNTIQHALLKKITHLNNVYAVDSVCAVGDEDQSIYSWRGAQVQNILDFHHDFKETKKIKLEQNYRSTQQILNIANNVIKHNIKRNHKQLWSNNHKEHKPMLLECLSDLQEAALVAQLVEIIAKNESRNSIAILYRTHYQSRIIEEALIKEAIPYKMIGGISFYERKEVKDLLGYLRLIHNPYDRISFFRVLNCPTRGLGEKFEEIFANTWNLHPFCSIFEIAQILFEKNELAAKQKTSLQNFITILKQNITASIETLLTNIINQTSYINYLNEHFDKQEASEKRDNVAEFLRAAQYFDTNNATPTLSQFLDEIALMQEIIQHNDDATPRVNMMTLHSAKGLEFNTVILVGVEQGILPSNQSIGQENIEEERRLFYVGITRAREKLLISYSKLRNVFGKLDQQFPSKFLQEINQQDIIFQPAMHWSRSGFATHFLHWTNNNFIATKTTPNITSPITSTCNNVAPSIHSGIKRLQAVKHKTFGTGIAHAVEHKGDKIIVTVHFPNHGTKKIDRTFLEII